MAKLEYLKLLILWSRVYSPRILCITLKLPDWLISASVKNKISFAIKFLS